MAAVENVYFWNNGEPKPFDKDSKEADEWARKAITTLIELWCDQNGQIPRKITVTPKELA